MIVGRGYTVKWQVAETKPGTWKYLSSSLISSRFCISLCLNLGF
jgi:hypothetical protein